MMNKNKKTLIISLILVALGLFGATTLVKRNQEVRRGAAFDKTTIRLSETAISGAVDSTVSVGLFIDTPRSVSTAKVKLCYGDAVTTDAGSITNVGPLTVENYKTVENNCVILSKRVDTSVAAGNLPKDSIQLANITFKIKKDGNITIDKSGSLIAGDPVSGSDDVNINIDAVSGATVKVIAGNTDAGTMSVESSDLTSKKVNETLSVKLFLNTTQNFDAAEAKLCYGDKLSLETSGIVKGSDFTDLAKNTISNNCVDYAVLSSGKTLTGKILLGTFTFKAIKEGSGRLEIDSTTADYSNSNGLVKVGSVTNADYSIQTLVTGINPILNFKMAFAGIKASANCANSLKVQVIARSRDKTTKPYVVTAVKDGSNSNGAGEAIYKVENLVLTDMPYTDQLSIFVKGPKHAQMKYGKDKQNDNYTAADGTISVTKDSTSPMLDFSGYPDLPGDITGPTAGNQDGWIRANDYAYMKSKSHETVSSGQSIDADLDGDCQVNAGDSTVFNNSLIEKQDQLY